MITVKIKKLNSKVKIPEYSHNGDACMDVYAISREIKKEYIEYETGLSFEIPEGYAMLIFPRSSISKKDLMLKNSVGVLDSSYRGELKLRFSKQGENIYSIGERVGQIMILPLPKINWTEVKEINPTSRGDGGFGSTGK
jgi:dUTP pyrophosphatase